MSLNRLDAMASEGRYGHARSYYRTCLDLAQATGNMEREATALMNLGLAHRGGDTEAGVIYYRDALTHYRELGRSGHLSWPMGDLRRASTGVT